VYSYPARNGAPPQLQYCKDADPTRARWFLSLTPRINILGALLLTCPSSQTRITDEVMKAINRTED
jgi:hypothetical protein